MPARTRGRLDGKAAIVTGAGTGIGEAIALKFAREGAKVLLNGLPGDPIEDVASAIRESGGEAATYAGDIAQEAHAKRCVEKAVETFGKLDVLVNNAGVFLVTAEANDYPTDDYEETLRSNVGSVFFMTKHALPELRKTRGNVVCAGSEAGKLGLAMNTVYGGTKAWVHAFTQGLAVEQAKHGVRANCVCPGAIDTAWTHKETGPMTADMEKTVVAATPMGRRGTVEEIANVYAFLASDEASFVTGALWSVDGGVTTAKGGVGDQVPDAMRKEPPLTLPVKHTMEGEQGKGAHAVKPK